MTSWPSTSAGPRTYLLVPSTEQVTITLSGSSTMACTCAGLVQSRLVSGFSMAVICARSLAVPLAASVAGAVGAGTGAVGTGAVGTGGGAGRRGGGGGLGGRGGLGRGRDRGARGGGCRAHATPSGKPTAPASGKATATPSAKATTPAKATVKPSSPASTSAGSGFPEALRAPAAATPSPTVPAPAKAAASTKATPAATATSAPAPVPTAPVPTAPVPAPTAPATDAAKGTASDLAQITPAIEKQLTSLDCTKPAQVQAIVDDPDKVMVTCSVDGTSKYVLGPAEVEGQDVKDAASGAELQPAGRPHRWL